MSTGYDLFLPWGGDIGFAPNADFRLVSGQDLAIQRIARGLMTNPAVRDAEGNIIIPGDDPFAQDWGAGLGQFIGQPNTEDKRSQAKSRIVSFMAQESTVDQSQEVTVTFYGDPESPQALYVAIEFVTLEGKRTQVGLAI